MTQLSTQLSIYFVFPGDLDTATGGYHYDRRLIVELRARGVEVETLSVPHCLPQMDSQTRESVRKTLAAIEDNAIVIIDGLAFGVIDDIAAAQAQRLCLIALCHHPLGLETGLDQEQRQALLDSERRALACARATIVTSQHTRKILIDDFSVPDEKIRVALPGTDRVPFASCESDPIRLLTVASLTRRKAHDVLIESLASIESLPWQARFVGGKDFDPPWAKSLAEKVEALGLSQRIEFSGAVADVAHEYRRADVFVLPSRFEGYGMVFAEALAAGLPVIAARAGAVPDVVPVEAGLLVAPDDAAALTEALSQMITDEGLRRRLQAGAQEAAQNLPSWSDTAAHVIQKLEEINKL